MPGGAITRLLRNHPYADTLGRAGHNLVHNRFCIESMVIAVQTIYDEGARSVRPFEVAAASRTIRVVPLVTGRR